MATAAITTRLHTSVLMMAVVSLFTLFTMFTMFTGFTLYTLFTGFTGFTLLTGCWCPGAVSPAHCSPPPATTAAAHIKYDARGAHWSLAINGHKIDPSTQQIMSLVPTLHWMVFYFNVILCAFYSGVQNNTVIIPANKEVFTPRPEPVPA